MPLIEYAISIRNSENGHVRLVNVLSVIHFEKPKAHWALVDSLNPSNSFFPSLPPFISFIFQFNATMLIVECYHWVVFHRFSALMHCAIDSVLRHVLALSKVYTFFFCVESIWCLCVRVCLCKNTDRISLLRVSFVYSFCHLTERLKCAAKKY